MRILDNYILRSIVTVFVVTVLTFLLLYVIIDITSQLDEFIDREVPIDIMVRYYINFIPIILSQTSAIACLIAVLLTYSGLNNNNEIIVMRASGLTFWQITKPALCFGLVVSAAVLLINERLVPQAEETKKELRTQYMILEVDRIRKLRGNIDNLTFYGLKNRLYFIDTYNPREYELEGINIIEYDNNQNIRQKILAHKGTWTGIAWKFYEVQVTEFDTGRVNVPLKVKVYNEKLMDIKETPRDFLKQRINVASMNIRELAHYIERFSDSGATRALNNLRVDLYQKIAYPIGNFVVILIGLPFALMIKSRKGMTFTTLGLAILIGFLYYVANAVSLAFGKGGLFPPLLAAWATPLLFTGVGVLVIKRNF